MQQETPVKITFLGTGAFSHTQNRANQSIMIEHDDCKFLVDCGPTTLLRIHQLNLNLSELSGIFITHFHGDHTFGLPQLDLALTLDCHRKIPFSYLGPVGLQQYFSDLYNLAYPDFFPNHQFERNFEEYLPNRTYTWGNISITTFSMKHKQESLGFVFQIGTKKIAVSGDSGWSEQYYEFTKDTDVAICECVAYHPVSNGKHMSYEEFLQYESLLKTKKLILTHIGQSIADNIDSLKFTVAQEGSTFIL